MKILRRLNENLEMYLLMIFLVVMTMVMGMQIFARYVLNSPLSWSEEVARFMFVWSGFVSVSYCIQKGIAIRIEQLVDFLPAKLRKAVDISVTLILLAYFIYILPYAYDFFFRSVEAGQLAPATQIPMGLDLCRSADRLRAGNIPAVSKPAERRAEPVYRSGVRQKRDRMRGG